MYRAYISYLYYELKNFWVIIASNKPVCELPEMLLKESKQSESAKNYRNTVYFAKQKWMCSFTFLQNCLSLL